MTVEQRYLVMQDDGSLEYCLAMIVRANRDYDFFIENRDVLKGNFSKKQLEVIGEWLSEEKSKDLIKQMEPTD